MFAAAKVTVVVGTVLFLWALPTAAAAQSSPHDIVKPSLVHIQAKATNAAGQLVHSEATGFLVSDGGLVLTVSALLSELGAVDPATVEIHAGLDETNTFPLRAVMVDSASNRHLSLLRLFGSFTGHTSAKISNSEKLTENGNGEIFSSGFDADGRIVKRKGQVEDPGLDGLWATDTAFVKQQRGGPVYDDEGIVVGVAGGNLRKGDDTEYFIPIELAESLLAPAKIQQVQSSLSKIQDDLKDPHDPLTLAAKLADIEKEIGALRRQFSWDVKSELGPDGKPAIRLYYDKFLPSTLQPMRIKVTMTVFSLKKDGEERPIYTAPDDLLIVLDPTSDPLSNGFFDFPREVVDAVEAVRKPEHSRVLVKLVFKATLSDSTELPPKPMQFEE